MALKTLPITELRSLLAAVSDHGKQHLAEVEADLTQTSYLLSEAIEKLASSFMSIHTLVTQQQEALDTLLAAQNVDSESLAAIEAFKSKIGLEANAAVTGLQFQDLTSQLIARTIKRVNGLRELLEELATHGRDIDPAYEHDEIAKFLEEMNHSLNIGSHALSGGLRRAVSQQDMDTGDIELF